MKKEKIYIDILQLLKSQNLGFSVLEQMIQEHENRIEMIEETILRIRNNELNGAILYKGVSEDHHHMFEAYDSVSKQIVLSDTDLNFSTSLVEIIDISHFTLGNYEFQYSSESIEI